jgi:V8-like Glu-specific endopeptidase
MQFLSRLLQMLSLQTSQRRQSRTRSYSGGNLETRALLCSCSGTRPVAADASTVAADPSENVSIRIVNGTATNDYPSVGKIGDTGGYGCSGTLIAPQYVLTAAHCAEGVSDTGGRFFVGGQEYRTTKVYVHPNYNPNRLGQDGANDIAIYKLDRPVTNVTPTPINRTAPAVGQLLTLVGFGGGGTGTTGHTGDYGTKRVGTTPIDRVTAQTIFWNFDNNSESNTAPGDSGGPAFVTIGGVRYVAGVTSGGDQANAGIGDRSFDTRVDAYAAWIDSIVGAPTNTTTVSISASDAAAAETTTSQAANPGRFIISRTGPTTASLTVNLTIAGTATNGTDFNTIARTVTIPAGATSANIDVTVRDDTAAEGSETVALTLAAGTGYAINTAGNTATVSIADNEVVTTNNNFANRRPITGTSATVTGSNVGATKETGEPTVAGVGGGKTVWWTWTAASSGPVTLTTAGSSFDTALGVYRGTAVNALTQVAANDDENARTGVYTSKVTFNAVAGTTYQIAVDGYQGATGSITLKLNQTVRNAIRAARQSQSADFLGGPVQEIPLRFVRATARKLARDA